MNDNMFSQFAGAREQEQENKELQLKGDNTLDEKSEMVKFTCVISKYHHKQLKFLALQRDTSASQIIREWIDEAVQGRK